MVTGCLALVGLLPQEAGLAFAFVLCMRFLFGMFQAGAFPALSRMMTDWMPVKKRGSAQGFIWMSSRVGALVVPFFFNALIDLFGSWQNALWVVAGLGVCWCVAFWPWFRNRPEEMASVNFAERELIVAGRPKAPRVHGPTPWRLLLRSRSVCCLCLMYACGGFAANFYITLLPQYLENQRHLSHETASWLQSWPFGCGLVACVTGGMVSDWIIRRTGNRKWGRRLCGTFGTSVGALGWLLIPAAGETWQLAVLLCVIFFCNDLSMGPAWAACADIGERYAGTVGGAMNMLGSFAGALGNLVAGFLMGKAFLLPNSEVVEGNHLVFVIYGCSFALAALCWQGVDATKTLTVDN